MTEQCEKTAKWPADHRPEAEWIDVTNLLRDGLRPSWAPAYAGELP